MKHLLLPGTLLLLSLISILILRSVAPLLLDRQVFFFVVGTAVFILSAKLPFQRWQQLGWVVYTGLIAALTLTQIIATVTRGTRSWIELGPFHIQPSQLAIAATALAVGKLVQHRRQLNLKEYLILLTIVFIPAMLIFVEPDLGTTVIYLLACGAGLIFCPVPPKHLLTTAACAMVAIVVGWIFLLKPYQKQRITSFFAMNEATHSASYNAVQSMIAVGSGRILGKGLGQGTQSQLRFLPERQTDFVFASFAEETGVIGGIIVVGCYAVVVGISLWATTKSQNLAEQLFALITGVMFLAQVGVNIGMNIGIVPITGITLPFVSYGGSSILALCWQVGCLQAIIANLKTKPKLYIR